MAELEPKVKTVAQTAKILKTSTLNVTALIKLGKLKTIRLSNTTLVPNVAIDTFIQTSLGTDLRSQISDWKKQTKLERQEKKIKKEGKQHDKRTDDSLYQIS